MNYREAEVMPSERKASFIQQIFQDGFNQGDLYVIDELFSPHPSAYDSSGGVRIGSQSIKGWIATFRTAFPDLHCTIEEEIREGDRVAARWTMSGTHLGLFMSNAPTGKQMKVRGMIFFRLAHGRIVEHWMLVDQLGVLQQLGIVPR